MRTSDGCPHGMRSPAGKGHLISTSLISVGPQRKPSCSPTMHQPREADSHHNAHTHTQTHTHKHTLTQTDTHTNTHTDKRTSSPFHDWTGKRRDSNKYINGYIKARDTANTHQRKVCTTRPRTLTMTTNLQQRCYTLVRTSKDADNIHTAVECVCLCC